jgi:DNA-binding transcriptional MerR regulator
MRENMAALADYKHLAPFTARELVAAVSELLRDKTAPTISIRTLRFYIAEKIVPAPIGSPKFARYGYEHLLTLLATRMLQDRGVKLGSIAKELCELKKGRGDKLEAELQDWLDRVRFKNGTMPSVHETKVDYMDTPPRREPDAPPTTSGVYRRIRLSQRTTLEIQAEADLRDELVCAYNELGRLIGRAGSHV